MSCAQLSSNPSSSFSLSPIINRDTNTRKRPRTERGDSTYNAILRDIDLLHNAMTVDSESGRVGAGSAVGVTAKDQFQSMRDERFYFSDANCIIQVDNVLFNVHRSILSQDFSLFSDLFTLPPDANGVEGTSDSNPVHLAGESSVEFRDLLWALYAMPHELIAMHIGMPNNAHIPKLLNIARMSHKYTFKSLEGWACDSIQRSLSNRRKSEPVFVSLVQTSTSHTDGKPSNLDDEASENAEPVATYDILPAVIRVAQLCQHSKLLGTALCVVSELMLSSDAYLTLALDLSDEISLPSLRGASYFEVLLRGPKYWTPEHISKAQKGRLLQAYFQLTTEWDKKRANPLEFEHAQSCGATWHQQGCATSWHDFWKKQAISDGLLKLPQADLGGKLKYIRSELDKWGQANYLHHECRVEVKRVLNSEIKSFEDRLHTYFTDL